MPSPVTRFFVPRPPSVASDFPRTVEEYWPWISVQDTTESWGPYNWTLQTYLYLSLVGVPCELVHELPTSGVVVAHRDFLPDTLRPGPGLYLACILADREQPGFIGPHPWAQFHVVQNPRDPKLTAPHPDWPAAFVPYWPQPGLKPRREERGERFETVAFFGYEHNLAPELRLPAWREAVEALRMRWVIPHRSQWHDYSEVDVIVAARSFASREAFTYKPPSKLHNAWRAGVPAILGRESAYQEWRQSPLDYLEVATVEEAVAALTQLRDDITLRQRMVHHGRQRAKEVSVERLVVCWQDLLQELGERWRAWQKMIDDERADFFQRRGAEPHAAAAVGGASSPELDADLVVLGSGFAAYEVTRVALGRGLTVAVLERGLAHRTPEAAEWSRIPHRREAVTSGGAAFGARVPSEFASIPRYVGLGGTSELWSGKWRPLDPIDLARSVDGRSWPLSYDELRAWTDAVARDYGLPDWSGNPDEAAVSAEAAACGVRLVHIYDQEPPVRLAPRWTSLSAIGSVRLIYGVDEIDALPDSSGERLRGVRGVAAGRSFLVRARHVVVACGGVASVWVSHRLRCGLRTGGSNTTPPEAAYGGFMDHPKAIVGEVRPRRSALFATYFVEAYRTRRQLVALSLPEDELQARGLGNHAVFLWRSMDAPAAAPFRIAVNVEQFPERDNAVLCGDSPAVVWRVSRATRANAEAFLEAILPRVARLIGPVACTSDLRWTGASHHAGALPMGEGGCGVVDRNGRFYDAANLYCASSAVFPTAGSANPTLAIAALARRLGEHLATRCSSLSA